MSGNSDILKNTPIFPVTGGLPLKDALVKCPELGKFLIKKTPPKLDLENREALILYNTVITREVLGIEVRLQNFAGLIPTPMLRYNFLKRLNLAGKSILEIGTGHTALISMVAAKCFHAKCTATESNSATLAAAREHIHLNKLEKQVEILEVPGDKLIHGVIPANMQFDVILSNPPYYDEVRSPRVVWAGDPCELIDPYMAEGNFCAKFFQEAIPHLQAGGIASVMVGDKQVDILLNAIQVVSALQKKWDIFGLKAGNRLRWVIRVYSSAANST